MPAPRTEAQRKAAALQGRGFGRIAAPDVPASRYDLRAMVEDYLANSSRSSSLGEAGANLPSSAWNVAKDLLAKPSLEDQAQMAKGYGTVLRGAWDYLSGTDSPDRQAVADMARSMWEPWSTPEKAKQTIVKDPVGTLAGVILPEGKMAKTAEVLGEVGKAGKKAKKLGKIATGPAADILIPQRSLGEMGDKVLAQRAAQMDLPEEQRAQPLGTGFFDTSPQSYTDPAYMPEQKPTFVPRPPEGKPYPRKGRMQTLADNQEAVAQELARRMKPYMGTEAQYFYNVGPIIKKGMELGISREQMDSWLQDFAKNYAATSPRTTTDFNMRNASLAMAREEAGIPAHQPVNPVFDAEAGGLNDRGYPMMVGESAHEKTGNIRTGIHKQLLDDVYGPQGQGPTLPSQLGNPVMPRNEAPGLNPYSNPKPSTFAENSRGNLAGVTVDTHAIRGALDAMNAVKPGSIPESLIKPEFREAYKNDPASFDAKSWVNDTLEGQTSGPVGPQGPQVPYDMQTEYAPFSDVYSRAAEILGVSPAEAQSMGWFGSGDKTGLMSEVKSIPTLLNDRIDVTSQLLGIPKEEVFKLLIQRKIPLAQNEAAGAQTAVG